MIQKLYKKNIFCLYKTTWHNNTTRNIKKNKFNHHDLKYMFQTP